jgi:ATP-binding cassette subfamily C (CFTR/MRP) protein 1
MANDPRKVEKEWEANDPAVGANTTAQEEPVASSREIDMEKSAHAHHKDDSDSSTSRLSGVVIDGSEDGDLKKPVVEVKEKQKLSRRINPLKRNPPPVPEKRGPSAEARAGWASRLTFQWITPLMTVSCFQIRVSIRIDADEFSDWIQTTFRTQRSL